VIDLWIFHNGNESSTGKRAGYWKIFTTDRTAKHAKQREKKIEFAYETHGTY
jgi:hypothetical protein